VRGWCVRRSGFVHGVAPSRFDLNTPPIILMALCPSIQGVVDAWMVFPVRITFVPSYFHPGSNPRTVAAPAPSLIPSSRTADLSLHRITTLLYPSPPFPNHSCPWPFPTFAPLPPISAHTTFERLTGRPFLSRRRSPFPNSHAPETLRCGKMSFDRLKPAFYPV
jgi:hypothetical protein